MMNTYADLGTEPLDPRSYIAAFWDILNALRGPNGLPLPPLHRIEVILSANRTETTARRLGLYTFPVTPAGATYRSVLEPLIRDAQLRGLREPDPMAFLLLLRDCLPDPHVVMPTFASAQAEALADAAIRP